MRRLNAVEVSSLVLAGAFVVTGASMTIHPISMYLVCAGTSRFDQGPNLHGDYMTRAEARILGIMSAAWGTGLAWLALRRPNPPDDWDDSEPVTGDLTGGPVIRTPIVPDGPRDRAPRGYDPTIKDPAGLAPELWRNN